MFCVIHPINFLSAINTVYWSRMFCIKKQFASVASGLGIFCPVTEIASPWTYLFCWWWSSLVELKRSVCRNVFSSYLLHKHFLWYSDTIKRGNVWKRIKNHHGPASWSSFIRVVLFRLINSINTSLGWDVK